MDTLSNGALHVVNTPPASGAQPTWRLREELRIGSVDEVGPASLAEVVGLAVTRDGRMAVLDRQAQELRVFSPRGEHLATFGGKGAGPGELEGAWGLMRDSADLLWVPDHRNARMSVFHPGDGFLRSYPLPHPSWGYAWNGALLDDGRIVRPTVAMTPAGQRESYEVFDARMNPIDTILLPPAPEANREDLPGAFRWQRPDGRMGGMMSVPFFARGQQAVDPGGGVWNAAPGDPSYRLAHATLTGDTTLIIETERAPLAVTATDRDTAVARIRESLRERGGDLQQDWSKIPDVKPAVSGLFLAEDGRLWVRTPTDGDGLRYDIYERDGRFAGTAVTELNVFSPIAPIVRGDTVWAVVTDELDVAYIVRARLVNAVDAAAP